VECSSYSIPLSRRTQDFVSTSNHDKFIILSPQSLRPQFSVIASMHQRIFFSFSFPLAACQVNLDPFLHQSDEGFMSFD
jgi:hypothetical protein